ncbi:hypothetical protein [Mediannikoviicoccus vaginalis]|uniref:hypothetical protein n=1 Tax=Mediannikoviicoccus vaginalis TaxID=2899727 RepID=UPI001F32283B|nr:hypothetical protein [Mediannikoviicoccus vaginalis]
MKNKERLQIVLLMVLSVFIFIFILDGSKVYTISKRNLEKDAVNFLLKYVPEDQADTKLLLDEKTKSSHLLIFKTGDTYTAVTYNKSLLFKLYTRDSVYYNIEKLDHYKIHQDNDRSHITYDISKASDDIKVDIVSQTSNQIIYNSIYALICFAIVIFGVYFAVKRKIKTREDD